METVPMFVNFDISNVTNLNSLFNGTAIKSIEPISGWNTSKVTSMKQTFQNCKALSDLSPLKNWDVSRVSSNGNFENIFNGCTSIKEIKGDLDGWMFNQAITSVANIFKGMTNLETLEVDWSEDGSMPGVNTAYQLFKSRTSLKNVSLNWNVPNISTVHEMFQDCNNLETVELDIPEAKITNGNFMFKGCTALKTAAVNVDFSNSYLDQIKDLFMGCSNLTSATNDCSANYSIDSNGKRKPLIKANRFVNTFKGCVKLRDASFIKYLSFEKWNIDSSLGADHKDMFYGCTLLTADHLNEILSTWDLTNRTYNGDDTLGTTATQNTTFTDYNGNEYSLESGKLIKQ